MAAVARRNDKGVYFKGVVMLLLKIIGFIMLIPIAGGLLLVGSVITLSVATAIYDVVQIKNADKRRREDMNVIKEPKCKQ